MRERCRWQVWSVLVLALLPALALFGPASPAGAATIPIVAGGADWGLKEALRDYVEEDLSDGAIAVSDGASRNPDGSFHFPLRGGSYDTGTGMTVVKLGGSIHIGGSGGELDLWIGNLSVEIANDGSALLGDIASGGSVFPRFRLGTLDVSGVEPVVAAGETTWTAIPATLAAGGDEALANLFRAGATLDPISFSYQGPGGKPIPETWTPPGAPSYEQVWVDPAALEVKAKAMIIDHDNDVLHAITAGEIKALSLSKRLSQRASIAPPALLPETGYAFDSERGTLFALPDSATPAPIRAFTFNSILNIYTEEALPIDAVSTTRIAYNEVTEKLYAIEGTGYPATPVGSSLTPAVAVAARNGSGWSTPSYPPLQFGGLGVSGLVATNAGQMLATMHASYEGSFTPQTIFPSIAWELIDNGSELTRADIYDWVSPPTPSSGYTLGFADPIAGPNGEITLVESSPPAPSSHALRLKRGWENSLGTTRVPVDLGPGVVDYAVDDIDGTGYAFEPGSKRIVVVQNDAVVATIKAPPEGADELRPTVGVASGGNLYFGNDVGAGRIHLYHHSFDAPTIITHPTDVVVTLSGPDNPNTVSFTASAEGTPTPSVRWQVRQPGSATWSPVPDVTTTTLKMPAKAASAGRRYRAVFSNVAGEIATGSASVSVRVLGVATSGGGAAGSDPQAARSPVAPARISRRPALRPGLRVARGAALVVRYNGVATLARVACRPPQPCRVEAPPRLRLRIGGEAYAAKVLAPSALSPDRSEPIRVQLPPRARTAIARTEAKATLPIIASSAEQRLERRLTVTLRGRDADS